MYSPDMPLLLPIQIPTRGLSWVAANYNWLFASREYYLGKNWHYRMPTGEDICIKLGYRFDGASIPRIFWFLLSPIGILLIPGLLHDYVYQNKCLHDSDGNVVIEFETRQEADDMMLEVSHVINGRNMIVLNLTVSVILKIFGGFAWRKHRANDEQ